MSNCAICGEPICYHASRRVRIDQDGKHWECLACGQHGDGEVYTFTLPMYEGKVCWDFHPERTFYDVCPKCYEEGIMVEDIKRKGG